MEQTLEIVAALLILAAFLGAQIKRMETGSLTYLSLNLVGSVVLATLAWRDRDFGFLLLEGVWSVVSAGGLVVALRSRGTPRVS